jgi:hypothetical protein
VPPPPRKRLAKLASARGPLREDSAWWHLIYIFLFSEYIQILKIQKFV